MVSLEQPQSDTRASIEEQVYNLRKRIDRCRSEINYTTAQRTYVETPPTVVEPSLHDQRKAEPRLPPKDSEVHQRNRALNDMRNKLRKK